MGLDFREVAKEITSALNLGEDEGKIDALAGSLEDAAIKSFGHSSELHTIDQIDLDHKLYSDTVSLRTIQYIGPCSMQ